MGQRLNRSAKHHRGHDGVPSVPDLGVELHVRLALESRENLLAGGRMAHTPKHAQRLLSKLVLPHEARQVLQHPRYWDPRFCDLYLDRCDEVIFHDRHAGLAIARVAPDLALLVPEPQGKHDDEEARRVHRERLVRAYAVLGGAYRTFGRYGEADECYRFALKIAPSVSSAARADLFQRLAALRACQERYDEAVTLAGQAADIFKSLKRFDQLACALAAQSFAYCEARRFDEALAVASEALCYSNPKVNPRVHYSATHNFAYAAIHSHDLDKIRSARAKIREARRLLRSHRRSIPKFKLYWVEGILAQKLFAWRSAERLFVKARKGFLQLDAPYEIALSSLDLSLLLAYDGRWTELKSLALETCTRFKALAEDGKALEALLLWQQAVEAESLERTLLCDVRETVIARMVEHRGAP